MTTQIIKHDGRNIWCYGNPHGQPRFEVTCADPANDGMYTLEAEQVFQNWTDVVRTICDSWDGLIEEIQAH